MKRALPTIALTAVLLIGRFAQAATLGEVCSNYGGTNQGQMSALCQGAYQNGNAAFIQDNNSRVYGSAAVVSAYGCMSGDSGACSSAVDSGTQAYANHTASANAFYSAQWTGQSAQDLASNAPTVSGSSGIAPPPALPGPCASAISGGGVSDRIACAVATDPSIPPIVQSPQFLAQFQNATGVPLQSVINQPPGALLAYAPSVLDHAYGNLKGSLSISDFMAKKDQLLGALLQKTGAGALTGKGAALAQAGPSQSMGSPQAADAALVASTTKSENASALASRTLASIDLPADAENHPEISLFQRVTHQYHRNALFTGSMSLSTWPTIHQ